MKKLVLILFGCLSFVSGIAQQNVGGFLQLSLGPEFMGGELAERDPRIQSGFANTGLNIQALFGHRMYRNLGVYASLTVDAYSINTQAMADAYSNTDPLYSWQAETNVATGASVSFGGQFNWNLKKSALNFRLGVSSCAAGNPELTLTRTTLSSGDQLVYKQAAITGSALGWNGGFSYRYEFKWSWTLVLNVDYIGFDQSINEVETTVTDISSGQETKTYVSYHREMRKIRTGLGVAYVF